MADSVAPATVVEPFASAPEILTAKELEALIRIDEKTIYSYAQRGLIPYIRIQSNLRFRKVEILGWLEKHSYRPRDGKGARRA